MVRARGLDMLKVSDHLQAARLADPAGVEPIKQLRKLGALRDTGITGVEEFEDKKREIMARI